MKRVRWSKRAERDLRNSQQYYEEHGGDAVRLTEAAVATITFVVEHPEAGQSIAGPSLRKVRVRRTRYILLYRIERHGLRVLYFIQAAQDWRRFS